MNKASDTPRTDEQWDTYCYYGTRSNVDIWEFSRQLERDLSAAEARVREMEAAIKPVIAPEGCPPWTLKICDLVDDDELRGIRKQVFTLSINQIRAIIRALQPEGEYND